MASLLCAPSSLALTKTNSGLQLQHKPKAFISFRTVRSQARDESNKSQLLSLTLPPQTPLSRNSTTATKASIDSQITSTDETEWDQTVEHVVFLQVREDKTKPWGVADALNSLKCLPGVLYCSAGNVGQTYGAPGEFNFCIHSRHATKIHRDRFMQHPLKYGFSMGYTEGICDDWMMLDHIPKHINPLPNPVYGSALRFVFLKLKDGVDESSLPEVVLSSFPGAVVTPTFGSIIEPCFTIPGTESDCVKGYNFAMHGQYASKSDLDASGTPEAFTKTLKSKLGGNLVDDDVCVFIHDYEVKEVYGGTFVAHEEY